MREEKDIEIISLLEKEIPDYEIHGIHALDINMLDKIIEYMLGRVGNNNNSSQFTGEELVGFFLGQEPDDKGRLITDYLNFSFVEIEAIHDFIQWAFPTSKPSQFNLRAPLIKEGFAETFQNNSLALNNYCLMCHRYLSHIGFNCKGTYCKNCEIYEEDGHRMEYWKIPTHNLLRITRMLQSLCEVGNHNCSRKVYEALLLKKEKENARLSYETLRFWKETQDKNDTNIDISDVSSINDLRFWALRTYYKYRIENSIRLGHAHSLLHWDNVYKNGKLLIDDEVNAKVLAAFAYTHDVFRQNDDHDPDHGLRAANMIATIRDTYLKFLDDDEFLLLHDACELHTIVQKTDNATINACFDADRLDLGRVGIIPDPNLMATEKGARIASEIKNTSND